MTEHTAGKPTTRSIPLTQLKPHPANSNVMPGRLVAKLADHIRRSQRYPPLIVRPIDRRAYQLLDGHHRVLALQQLGHTRADCVVWQTDDHEALLMLATLNRLQGRDDPKKRASLLASLNQRHDVKALADLLPERTEQVRQLLELNARPPSPRAPKPVEQMPLAVHFFLLPDQQARLNRRLKALGGSREEALMKLIDNHAPSA